MEFYIFITIFATNRKDMPHNIHTVNIDLYEEDYCFF